MVCLDAGLSACNDKVFMKLKLRELVLAAATIVTLSAFAPVLQPFTAAEQQQISIATPNLFEKSDVFYLDFTKPGQTEYSFPLPVGKARVLPNLNMEIETKKGDAVKAMFDGVVRLSRKLPDWGNVIVVRHANGLETVYGNNAQNLVKVGTSVKAGQTIAIVGESGGRTYGVFAVMVDGRRVQPGIIIDTNSYRLRRQLLQCKQVGSHVDVAVVSEAQRSLGVDPDNPFGSGNSFKLNLAVVEKVCNWAYPLPNAKVISPYGGKRHHGGVDLKTKPNDKIVAAFDGVVTLSGSHYGYGNCITLKHKYGFETLYSHQSKNFVKVGQKVKAGDVIGLTGRTGRATTEHLHFEVKYRGKRLNPTVLFDCRNRKLQDVTLTLTKSGNVTSKRNN